VCKFLKYNDDAKNIDDGDDDSLGLTQHAIYVSNLNVLKWLHENTNVKITKKCH
jgi:hypothetical protein